MKLKRILLIIAVMFLALALVGCGSVEKGEQNAPSADSAITDTSTPDPEPEPEPEPENPEGGDPEGGDEGSPEETPETEEPGHGSGANPETDPEQPEEPEKPEEPAEPEVKPDKNGVILPAEYKGFTIEANKKKTGFRINEAGEVANEDLFASIISKHRGKVVLIDFWATWCGPCVAGHKSMRPMKAELADKDIVYVYIAGENSPKERWEQMTPEIHGEHYRLTHEQWDYLWKTFNISGIPTYFIHDRDGNITFRCSGFPGVTQMKEELMKALN